VEISNKGVQILLNRMDSFPDEFVNRSIKGPWEWVMMLVERRVIASRDSDGDPIHKYELPFLTDDEVNALYEKYLSVQGEAFTNRVMSQLLIRDQERSKPKR
jgi:hypothetical protein